jgi:excisionase family DNA binding protein
LNTTVTIILAQYVSDVKRQHNTALDVLWLLEQPTMKRQAEASVVLETAPRREPGLATVKDAERYLNLSRATIYGLMDQGQLRFVKIGKSRRIPWPAIEELVQKNMVGA